MDIEQARKEIEKLEAAINNLIWNFENQTGLIVKDIDLRTIQHLGGGKVRNTSHTVNVDVPLNPRLE